MTQPTLEPTEITIAAALTLLQRPEEDAYSVLGIQAEQLELAEQRLIAGRRVPVWTGHEGFERVLSPQRAPREELARYATRGLAFARHLMARITPAAKMP